MKFLLCAFAAATVVENNALTKVVKKLQGMLEQSQKDGETDRTEFAKLKCKGNTAIDEAKTQIEKSTELIQRESGSVEQLRGANGKLSQEIASLTQQLADNQDQQGEATAEREKQKEDFNDKKTDLEGAVGQLGEAITTLAEIGADQTAESRDTADRDRFLKGSKTALVTSKSSNLLKSMREVAQLLPEDQRSHMKTVTAFLEAPFSGTYTAQSGQIVGVLKNMKDTFENDLDIATKQENKRQASYDELIELLETDAATMEETRTNKKGELSDNSAEITSKKKVIADNETTKADNEDIVDTQTEELAERTKKYEGRRATRASEEAAISKAVAILNSDAAFGNKSFSAGPGSAFVQIRKHNFENPFSTVLVEIEKMIKAIGEEEKADDEKKAWCEKENAQNDENVANAKTAQDEQAAKIATVEGELVTAKENLELAQTAIKSLQDNRKELVEQRQEGNQRYQATIAELNEAHEILKRGVEVLRKFYEAEATAKSAEDHEYQEQGGGEVIALLEDIQKDTEGQETTAHADEESEQGFFETDISETDQSIADEQRNAANERANIADAEERLLAADTEHGRQVQIENKVEAYKASIKPGCDFILDNYDTRKKNRATEKGQLEFAQGKVKEREAAHTA